MSYPIKFLDTEKSMLLLDTIFATDDYLKYANDHNMAVKYTDTTSTSSIETVYKFIKAGFTATFDEERVFAPDRLELNPRIVVYLRKDEIQ